MGNAFEIETKSIWVKNLEKLELATNDKNFIIDIDMASHINRKVCGKKQSCRTK